MQTYVSYLDEKYPCSSTLGVMRIIDDQRTAKTITILESELVCTPTRNACDDYLKTQVRMIPEGTGLIRNDEVVKK